MSVKDRLGHETTTHERRVEVEEEWTWRRRVSGAAIWSGFAVAIAVWALLELLLAAVDLVPLGLSAGELDTGELWWTGGASLIALFVGGVVAGAASRSRTSTDGALHGVITWAVTVVAIVVLSALGAGIGFGAFGESLSNAGQQQAQDTGFGLSESDAEEAAGVAALFLGLTVAAAGAGGVLGSTMAGPDVERRIDLRS